MLSVSLAPAGPWLQVLVVNYVVPEGGAPGSPSPSPSPPTPSPSPVSSSPSPATAKVSVPTVTFTSHITTYAAPADFGGAASAAYTSAITSSIACVDARVLITGITAGSVYVDTEVLFLVSNGNTDAASAFLSTLQSSPATIFPAATFGSVGVSGATLGATTITINPSLLSAPGVAEKPSHLGAIVGGAVGGGLGAVLLLGVVWYMVKGRRGRPTRASATLEVGGPQTPMSPTSPSAFISTAQPKSDGRPPEGDY